MLSDNDRHSLRSSWQEEEQARVDAYHNGQQVAPGQPGSTRPTADGRHQVVLDDPAVAELPRPPQPLLHSACPLSPASCMRDVVASAPVARNAVDGFGEFVAELERSTAGGSEGRPGAAVEPCTPCAEDNTVRVAGLDP